MFGEENDTLFSTGDLHTALGAQFRHIEATVDAVPKAQFLATTEDTLSETLEQKLCVEPIQLFEDRMELEHNETQIDVTHDRDRNFGARFRDGPLMVPGTRVVVSIPFFGDSTLWKLQPSSYDFNPPRGRVRGASGDGTGYLDLVFNQPSDASPEQLKGLVDGQLARIRRYVENQRPQIESENPRIKNRIREAIRARRARIESSDKISSALGIPLKRRGDVPDPRPLPLRRRLVRTLPPAPSAGYQPEPGITDEDYEYILNVIRHEGRTFEATPRTFRVHDEEELRDILLAHLNGHFDGGASGETFRKRGKTDIRIEQETRAAFVAECKIWRGPESFKDATEQLLSYLTWRDGKTALVFFNVNVKGFKGIQEKVPLSIREHSLFLREKPSQHAGEWRAAFRLKDDEAREVLVHVFLFDMYVDGEDA